MNLSDYCVWFIIYSFIGWIYESSLRTFNEKRFINSGFLNGPYIPIYGFGAIVDIFLLGSIKNPIILFLLSGIVNCVIEYLTSYIMEKMFHARWWDYSNLPFNLNGRICLLGFVAFGLFAVIVILFFHPWLIAHTTALLEPKTTLMISYFIVIILVTDTYITVINMKSFKQKFEELSISIDELKTKISGTIESTLDNYSIDDIKNKISDTIGNTLDNSIDKIKLIQNQLTAQEKRLINAFPTLKFNTVKYEAREILEMIKKANKEMLGGKDE